MNFDSMARALGFDEDRSKDVYRYGTVASVNTDGSCTVSLGNTESPRCASLYSASVGDRVQVVIKANGSCVVLGKVGSAPSTVKLGNGAMLAKVGNTVMFTLDDYSSTATWDMEGLTELKVPAGYRPLVTAYVPLVNLAYLSCRLKVNTDGSIVYQGNDNLNAGYELWGGGSWLTA